MQFRAVVVEPVGSTRIIAVQAIRVLAAFQDVQSSPGISEARSYCLNRQQVDLIFLSYRLNPEQSKNFIAEMKQRFAKTGCAFISVLRSVDASDMGIACALAQGTDGILCEPYSVEQLNHCLAVAAKMKLSGGKERAKAGISFALISLVNQLQEAEAKGATAVFDDKDKSWRELTEICRNVKALATMAGASYEEIISEIFSEIGGRAEDMRNTVSRRLQEKFQNEEKAREIVRTQILALN